MEKADIPTESFSHQSFTGLTSVASETGFIHVSDFQKKVSICETRGTMENGSVFFIKSHLAIQLASKRSFVNIGNVLLLLNLVFNISVNFNVIFQSI